MKSIFLSVVIICALAIAGIGGTLATWSDSETSADNFVQTGALDLKVNGADDAPWGTGVPTKLYVKCAIPDKYYGPFEVELWNAGECKFPSHAYLHLKRYECSNVEPKINPYPNGGSAYWPEGATTGYPAPDGTGLKPEPELVAEYGGKVDCTTVPGIGPEGDDCSMGSHVVLYVTDTPTPPNVDDPDREVLIFDDLYKWFCNEIYLFDLMPCQPKMIYLWVYIRQDTEESWGYDFIPDPIEDFPADDPDFDAKYMHWVKFNDWPSWAIMADRVDIDIEYDLWLEDTPGGVVPPDPDDLPDAT